MTKKKIVVVGSTNMDMVVKANHIPVSGETILGGDFFMNPGGKGANQAVTVARLGGNTAFITKVGSDIFGKQAIQLFDDEGIDITGVLSDPTTPSGVALITVDEFGENSIVVASGANANLKPRDVEKSLDKIGDCEILLLQLEIPMDAVAFSVEYANANGIKVILNPAPENSQVARLFPKIDVITPNRYEAEMLTGIKVTDLDTAKKAAQFLHTQGVKSIVITLGSKGAILYHENEFHIIPAIPCKAIDTTAAGDVFCGALAVAIAEGKDMLSAVQFACKAAAISVTRMGAQSSIPNRNELIVDIINSREQ